MIKLDIKKRLRGAEGKMHLQVSFSLQPSSIAAIMGPSGAGKTSILKMIAGLLQPDEGFIEINEEKWFNSKDKINKLPQKRNIGFVFQEYTLFPNMSVRENLTFALHHKQDQAMIDEVLSIMNIQNLQHQKPSHLSGGQQQRVALARAIVRKPQILLLDEPFAALDRSMRLKLQEDLIRLHERYNTTTLMVSHDVLEVARMADHVILMQNGHVEKTGAPEKLLPMMKSNTLEGEVVAIDYQSGTVTLAISYVLGEVSIVNTNLTSVKKGDHIIVHAEKVNLVNGRMNR